LTVAVRRDSKLTRVLQASLSGAGARIAVVACVTPASSQAEETHNTLKFATRAKKVWDHFGKLCALPPTHAA
jgi:centromeric protein E